MGLIENRQIVESFYAAGIRDGKISEVTEYLDTQLVTEIFGSS